MQNFNERLKPTIQVRALLSACPYIIISRKALDKMYAYVDGCPEEIGWLGTAERIGREIYIIDTYLFDQEVHATTTEITPEGLSDFAMELLQQEGGMEIWNNMKVWGHSHVNMGVTPSGQDDSQMATFQEGGHDWFIRLIANKKGDLKIDLYDYTSGVIYLDLPWEAEIDADEEEAMAELAILEARIKEIREEKANVHQLGIHEEMKVKVRKKTYTARANTSNWGSRGTNTENTTSSTTSTTAHHGTDEKKTNGTNAVNGVPKGSVTGSNFDFFENDDQVVEEIGIAGLLEIAQFIRFEDVAEVLLEYGYFDCFTDDDVERIMKVSKKTSWQLGGKYK